MNQEHIIIKPTTIKETKKYTWQRVAYIAWGFKDNREWNIQEPNVDDNDIQDQMVQPASIDFKRLNEIYLQQHYRAECITFSYYGQSTN